jgi:DNA-binding NarL/FixJ family response regulator
MMTEEGQPANGGNLGETWPRNRSTADPEGHGTFQPPPKVLTPAEARVLQLILDGKSNRQIAAMLHRSERTVEVHRSHLMAKLDAHNLVELVRKVFEKNT